MFSQGKLLNTSYKDGIFTASGISNGAYHSSLGLKTLQRILSLITPDLAVVFDFMSFVPSSPVKKIATLLNNIEVPFVPYKLSLPGQTLNGLKINHGNETFYAVWLNKFLKSPHVNLTYERYYSNGTHLSPFNDSIANVTFDCSGAEEQNLFLFYTNRINIIDITFKEGNDSLIVITVDYLNVHSGRMSTVKQILGKEQELYVITSIQSYHKNNIYNVKESKSTLDYSKLPSKRTSTAHQMTGEDLNLMASVQNYKSSSTTESKSTPQPKTLHENTFMQNDYTIQAKNLTFSLQTYHTSTVMLLSGFMVIFLFGLNRKRMLNRYGILVCCSSFAGKENL